MKERELRRYAKCSICGSHLLPGLPIFARVTVERIGIKMDSVLRADALATILGGSNRLAEAMGPDEDMTVPLGDKVTLSICEKCYIVPVVPAFLAELVSVEPPAPPTVEFRS